MHMILGRALTLGLFACLMALFTIADAGAQAPPPSPTTLQASLALPHTTDVGTTGFTNKRPVVAAAYPTGCPWGDLGKFVQASMKPMGYDVVLCLDCNRFEGPRLVSTHALPLP